MGNALVTAMAFFVWCRTRFPRYLARWSIGQGRQNSGERIPFSMCVSGLSKTQAEDLLDWLEATGHHRWKLDYTDGEGFSVSYS
jgi:hypothetical protein